MLKAPPLLVATTKSGEILRYMSMAPFILLCCGVFGLPRVLRLSQPLVGLFSNAKLCGAARRLGLACSV
jgi:hypothetical protein